LPGPALTGLKKPGPDIQDSHQDLILARGADSHGGALQQTTGNIKQNYHGSRKNRPSRNNTSHPQTTFKQDYAGLNTQDQSTHTEGKIKPF
jgi:hypothetical protein